MKRAIDIPTALSPAECRMLQRYARGRRVVEAGALLGYSTVALAQVAASVASIDRHEGYGAPTLGTYLRNLDRYGVRGVTQVVIADALSVLPMFAADLTFIDLDGARDTLTRAIASCRSELIALHDYNRPYCDIPIEGLEVIGRVDSLIIGRRRDI